MSVFHDVPRISLNDPVGQTVKWTRLTVTDEAAEEIDQVVPSSGVYEWIPLFCLMLAQMGASFGIQGIPFILSSEYFPTAIRPQVWLIFPHGH